MILDKSQEPFFFGVCCLGIVSKEMLMAVQDTYFSEKDGAY
jgi:hypothetical protein